MSSKKKSLILIIILICLGFLYYFTERKKHDTLFLSGRLEGYETDVAPKVGGRIDYVVAREGAAVHKGELIVKLDDSDLQARLKAANATIEISKHQEKQAELQLVVVQNQIQQANLSKNQSKAESMGTIQQSKASLSASDKQYIQAQEELKQANYDLDLATTDFKRYTNLVKNGSIPKHTYDIAKTKYETAESNLQFRQKGLEAAESKINEAQGALIQANSTKFTPPIRTKQISLTEAQFIQAKAQLEAAKANIKKTNADKEEILAQIAYLHVLSPIDGIIIARTVEPGEVVSAGKTLLTLLNLNTVYLRGYIPEGKIGLVRVGQKAKVYLDSSPDKPLDAYLSEIDITASFTPENIYFKDDRVKQVFGVKLAIVNPGGFAKPGMPADAEILLHKKTKKISSHDK